MAYRKATLRKMLPVTRKVARLIGELDSVALRLKNALEEVKAIESDAKALRHARMHDGLLI